MKAVSKESLEILDRAMERIQPMSFPYTVDGLYTLRNAIEAELKEQQPVQVPDQSEKDNIFQAAVAYGAGLAANEDRANWSCIDDAEVSFDFANALYDKIYK